MLKNRIEELYPGVNFDVFNAPEIEELGGFIH